MLPLKSRRGTVGIILAAGRSCRCGGSRPKQFVNIAGLPLFVHSLLAFEQAVTVQSTILVLPVESIRSFDVRKLRSLYGLGKLSALVAGGRRRADSVFKGLSTAAAAGYRDVAIHDAARPFVHGRLIDACVRLARRCGAAIVAIPVNDTLKEVRTDYRIARTVPRERLWQVQTPQAFDLGLIYNAHLRNRQQRLIPDPTDDSCLVEAMGKRVMVVQGSSFNFKITTYEDMKLARLICHLPRTGIS